MLHPDYAAFKGTYSKYKIIKYFIQRKQVHNLQTNYKFTY